MECKMEFSMAIFKWVCRTHREKGDELGCLTGARERIAELEAQSKELITKLDEAIVWHEGDCSPHARLEHEKAIAEAGNEH